MECIACQEAKNKIVSVERALRNSPLAEKLPWLIEQSRQSQSGLNGLWLEKKCVYNAEGRICTRHKSDVENVEIDFLRKVKKDFIRLFGAEANIVHWGRVQGHDHKEEYNIRRVVAAEFEDVYFAEKAFRDLEKMLAENAVGEVAPGINLQKSAKQARLAAGILCEFADVYGIKNRNPDVANLLHEILIAEGEHYNVLLNHCEFMLDKKATAHRSESDNSFDSRAGTSGIAAGAFLFAGLMHFAQQPAYESFRNAVASLPIIKDLGTPLAIPVEFLLFAGTGMFFLQSVSYAGGAQRAGRIVYLVDLKKSANELEKTLSLQNIKDHADLRNGDIYVKLPLLKSDGSVASELEFRLSGDAATRADGSMVCNRADGQSFEALRNLYFLARNCFRHAGGLKNGFDDEGIATYIFKDGTYIRYKLGFFGGIKQVGGDVRHSRGQLRELQMFYLSEKEKAKESKAVVNAQKTAHETQIIERIASAPPAPVSVVAEPLNWDKKSKSLGIGMETAELKWNNKLKLL